jgi:hypothetical protein
MNTMRNSGYCERPLNAGFAIFLLLGLTLIAGFTPTVGRGQEVPVDSIPFGKNSIYAKIILPVKEPEKGKHPVVESWIAKKLKKHGNTDLRAVTGWVRLAEEGQDIARIWDATLDGKIWGCPVTGRVVERTVAGRVKVHLSGWAPFVLKVKGTSFQAETGSRKIAVVDDGRAYVALFVGPPPVESGSPRRR